MPTQSAEMKRCATCDRWGGERQVADAPGCVSIAVETASGLCRGGPWDGELRRARAACGRWIVWQELGEGPGQ